MKGKWGRGDAGTDFQQGREKKWTCICQLLVRMMPTEGEISIPITLTQMGEHERQDGRPRNTSGKIVLRK